MRPPSELVTHMRITELLHQLHLHMRFLNIAVHEEPFRLQREPRPQVPGPTELQLPCGV